MDDNVSTRGFEDTHRRVVPGRWQRASGAGCADGSTVGETGGGGCSGAPQFDAAVPQNGYRWWYVDAISSDGDQAFTIIAFIGSVFSPYYAFARRKTAADPENFCAINVALYGARRNRWCMTERGRAALLRNAQEFRVGPSSLTWDGTELRIDVDEITVPIPRRVKGVIRIKPDFLCDHVADLDPRRLHQWRPIAPSAAVEVRFNAPSLSWSGRGYWDSNWGSAPLESSFQSWIWSRAAAGKGAAIAYDVLFTSGERRNFCLAIDGAGNVENHPAPPQMTLPKTLWRVERSAHSENGVRLLQTLEDTPFYARSIVENTLFGQRLQSVHESLSLSRFTSPVVQAMLPFRMPRRSIYRA
jgi:carotenoid 1,2-hydratase